MSANKKGKKGKKSEDTPTSPSGVDKTIFNPDQDLIYFYFFEKEKARKISQGKEVKSLFGVKKCQDVQRYRKFSDSTEEGFFTFLGFSNYDEVTAGINVIKSKWLADGQIKIYESTKAYEKHQNPDDSDYDDIEELLIEQIDQMSDKDEKEETPTAKQLNINNVQLHLYKSIQIEDDNYLSFSQLSVPNNVQNNIKLALTKIDAFKSEEKNIIIHKTFYEPYTFFFLNFKNNETENVVKDVLQKSDIEFFIENSEHIQKFILFDERLIPDSVLDSFLHFVSLILGVYEIKRNVFYFNSVVTLIFYEDITEKYLLGLLEQFLSQEGCLFDQAKYPLKNSIYLNKDVILKDVKDFRAIVSELENKGLKPISVEDDKLLFFRETIKNCFIQKFSFICFGSPKDKMIALNHINQIVFNGKQNVLKYNPALWYMKYDPLNYSLGESFDNVKNDLDGIMEVQKDVLSIENPVPLTYLAFDSVKLLNKAKSALYSIPQEPDLDDDEFGNENKLSIEDELLTENLVAF